MSDTPIGQECKLYYNAGTRAARSWVEIKRAVDVTLNLSKGDADTSRRESSWELKRGALKQAGIDFGYRYKVGADTVFDALLDSVLNNTPIELAAMDGDIATAGSQGLAMFCEIMQANRDEPLADGVSVAFTAAPTDHEEGGSLAEPEWLTISA